MKAWLELPWLLLNLTFLTFQEEYPSEFMTLNDQDNYDQVFLSTTHHDDDD